MGSKRNRNCSLTLPSCCLWRGSCPITIRSLVGASASQVAVEEAVVAAAVASEVVVEDQVVVEGVADSVVGVVVADEEAAADSGKNLETFVK